MKSRLLGSVAAVVALTASAAHAEMSGTFTLNYTDVPAWTDYASSDVSGSIVVDLWNDFGVQVDLYNMTWLDGSGAERGYMAHFFYRPNENFAVGVMFGYEDYFGSPYWYPGFDVIYSTGPMTFELNLNEEHDEMPIVVGQGSFWQGRASVSYEMANGLTLAGGALLYDDDNPYPFAEVSKDFGGFTVTASYAATKDPAAPQLGLSIRKDFGSGAVFRRSDYASLWKW